MKQPKVVLKSITTFEGMEGTGFNADMWINGVKCMFVINDASGGEYIYRANKDHKHPEQVDENIKLLEDYIKNQPEQTTSFGDGKPFTYKLDMDIFIDNLIVKQEKEKLKKQKKKQMQTGILIGNPNKIRYGWFNFKKPLNTIPKETLQLEVNKIVLTECKNGIVILNNNLAELGITIP